MRAAKTERNTQIVKNPMDREDSVVVNVGQLKRWWITCFLAAGFLLFAQPASARPISIGSIGDAPAEEIQNFLSLANYLAKHLRSEGIEEGKVVVTKSIPEMAAFFRAGKVDLYIDSPFPSVAVSRLSGSKLFLRRWKKGLSDYYAVFFTKTGSGIDLLSDLKGKIISLKDPYSSSGYFLPKMALMGKGLRLVAKKDASEPVLPDEVGYVFSDNEENGMMWVLRGKVSAGAMDNQRYLEQAGKSVAQLKIIYQTFSIPRHIVSYRPGLSPEFVARIKETLIRMDHSEEGRKALRDFEGTSKFDELPAEAMRPFSKAGSFIDAEFRIR